MATIELLVYLTHHRDRVERCIHSILVHTPKACSITFISECMPQVMAQRVSSICTKTGRNNIKFYNYTSNLGYDIQMIHALQSSSSQYVALLNDNVIVHGNWISKLYACLVSEPCLGVSCPFISGGIRQNLYPSLPSNLKDVCESLDRKSKREYPRITSADICLLINRAVLEKVNLKTFKIKVGIEPDLCHEARRHGFSVAIADDLFVGCDKTIWAPLINDDEKFFKSNPLGKFRLTTIKQSIKVEEKEVVSVSEPSKSIKIYSPSDTDRKNEKWWGDYWVRKHLLEAFEHQGWIAKEPDQKAEISILLKGKCFFDSNARVKTVWIYSHPEDEVQRFLSPDFKLVYTLSQKHADRLRLTRSDVKVLLPATSKVYPGPRTTVPQYDILIVGNADKPERVKAVKHLISTGRYKIAVVGARWEEHIGQQHILGAYWENDQYSELFNQAATTIYVHHEDMRQWNFVAVRILDIIACSDCFVISDYNEGLQELGLGDIPQFHDMQELEQLVDHYLARPDERIEKLKVWRDIIQISHSFEGCTKQIIRDVDSLSVSESTIKPMRVRDFLSDQKIVENNRPVNPKVSVIMPTYCRGDSGKLENAIKSVLRQTFNDFELIIVDDGSVDSTRAVIRRFMATDSRIVYIRHEDRCALPAIRVNEAALEARGKYIAYQFDDDWWEDSFLEEMTVILDKASGPSMAYGKTKARVVGRAPGQYREYLGDIEFNYGLLRNANYIANNSVVHHKSVFGLCGMYDPHIIARRWCDYDLWLRMAKVCQVFWCPKHVANVEAALHDSIGIHTRYDLVTYRRYIDIDRNIDLMPNVIKDRVVDGLEFLSLFFTSVQLRKVYEKTIKPFQQDMWRLDTNWDIQGSVVAKTICVSKTDYSTSTDVVVKHYCDVLQENPQLRKFGTKSMFFVIERDLVVQRPEFFDETSYDYLVLHRTVSISASTAVKWSHTLGKSILYFMDDNMLTFHELDPQKYSYLAPGSLIHKNVIEQLAEADVVVAYGSEIAKSVEPYNKRVVRLHTSIKERYVLSSVCCHSTNLKYAILSGPARESEIRTLWPTIIDFMNNYKNIELYVWGIDLKANNLSAPIVIQNRIHSKPFNHNYEQYIGDIARERFDFTINPLFGIRSATLSKSPVKYLETTVAGAVGIYSNVIPYEGVQDSVTGLKCEQDGWYQVLEKSAQLSYIERERIFTRAKQEILRDFTVESEMPAWSSVFEIADLHRKLESRKSPTGRAKIAYFVHEPYLGGATLHLFKHALMMRNNGFDVVFCIPERTYNVSVQIDTIENIVKQNGIEACPLPYVGSNHYRSLEKHEEVAAESIKYWLKSNDIKLVHGVLYYPTVYRAAHELNIPIVCTLHQYYEANCGIGDTYVNALHSSSTIWGHKWQDIFKCPLVVIPAPIDKKYFELFNVDRKWSKEFQIIISGTLQPRKRQMEAVLAVHALLKKGYKIKLKIVGYTEFCPEYVKKIQKYINAHSLRQCVQIVGFKADTSKLYSELSCVLCTSDEESLPQTILKGMAGGLLVVSTPVGGVPEVIEDRVTGFLSKDFSVENIAEALERCILSTDEVRCQIIQSAHNKIYDLCREDVVNWSLLKLYNIAVDNNNSKQGS